MVLRLSTTFWESILSWSLNMMSSLVVGLLVIRRVASRGVLATPPRGHHHALHEPPSLRPHCQLRPANQGRRAPEDASCVPSDQSVRSRHSSRTCTYITTCGMTAGAANQTRTM